MSQDNDSDKNVKKGPWGAKKPSNTKSGGKTPEYEFN